MTPILVDTHALLWWLDDDRALTSDARSVIADPAIAPLVSAASLWEISIKLVLGKLDAPKDLPDVAEAEGFGWLPIDERHGWAAGMLPDHHQDPFDRMLIAQAQVEGLPIVTGDPAFAPYGVSTIW